MQERTDRKKQPLTIENIAHRDVDHNDHNYWLLLEPFLVMALKTRITLRDNVVLVFHGWGCA
jgi:hypothetical protein